MTEIVSTRSTCPYCGVGCGVIIDSDGAQITGVRGDPDHPANAGRLCSKGQTLHFTAAARVTRQARLLQPMRRAERGAAPQPLGWDAALDEVATWLHAIATAHGPDAIGLYISGQLLTEDYYVFNKFAKGLLGTNHIDTNSRLCMSSAVAGYKATLGADAPPACYEDLDHADLVFITGSNLAWAHPVLMRRLEDARRARPAQRWIVVDPRRTETAAQADLHLPILPGSDVALYHGLLHLLLWEGQVDAAYIAAHTEGFDALKARVREFTPRETARLTGLKEADIVQAAQWFGSAKAVLSLYCQGLNQSVAGTDKNAALINLHLATGQIGRAGAGPFSLTGQPNAMGGREVGGMANLLSAHRDLANPEHRAEVARLWGVPAVPATPGLTAVELFEAAAEGRIRALWIVCTNPAQSLPDQALVRRALQRCEFVVVQEAYATTATCDFADLLLPASSWGEKEGTVTNSERRISRVRAAVPPPGEARADWRIAVDVARRLEALRGVAPAASLFPYDTPESIWNEHRESTRGRDLDITGLSYPMLEAEGPQQWPCPEGARAGTARLYAEGRFPTASGRARFADVAFRGLAEPRDARHPFSLITGRLRDQWHGMSRTGTLGRLYGHVGEPSVQIHPQDMARLGLADGDLVRLRSRRGEVVLAAEASDSVAPAQAFVAMHWGGEVLSGHDAEGAPLAGINQLTTGAFCPRSKQPELKHTAVRIEKAALPWRLAAFAWLDGGEALAVRERLRPLLARFAHATLLPFGRETDGADAPLGLALHAADRVAQPDELIQAVAMALGLSSPDTLVYRDARRALERRVAVEPVDVNADANAVAVMGSNAGAMARATAGAALQPGRPTRLRGALLAGDAQARGWLRGLLESRSALPVPGRQLLMAGATPPQAVAVREPRVCTCLDVAEGAITTVLARCDGSPDQRLAALQGELKCGTQCGSCLPTLRRLVAQTGRMAQAAQTAQAVQPAQAASRPPGALLAPAEGADTTAASTPPDNATHRALAA